MFEMLLLLQGDFDAGGGAAALLGSTVGFGIGLVFYIYVGFCLMTMANKNGVDNGWFGFIPILNIVLMVQLANRPLWWIILFFIPFVNIIAGIIVWMGIAESRNKPSWWGILIIVPFVNLIVPGYLAFTD